MQRLQEALDAVCSLCDDADRLSDIFASGDVSSNDWGKMCRYLDKLSAMRDIICVESDFALSVFAVGRACREIEDEKSRFLAEKALKEVREHYFQYKKDILLSRIDSLINISKTWSFEDYRGIEFQKDVKKVMLEVKEWAENKEPKLS